MNSRLVALFCALGIGAVPPSRLPDASRLGGAVRHLTALATDKPIYREDEVVYVSGVVLESKTRAPAPAGTTAAVTIKGPKGEIVFQSATATEEGVWSMQWRIPSGTAGGQYTLLAEYPTGGSSPAERSFEVRAYRAPRFRTQIDFLRDGYGPGDRVTATLDVKRAEGGIPVGATVTASARVDEDEVAKVPCRVDPTGLCRVQFDLPKTIARGEGTLSFAIEDGGVVETAAKTIPILLQTLDIAFYPEGGELVAGVANRVYFEARTPSQKPADLEGDIVESQGGDPTRVVATVKSVHEGRGKFSFQPRANTRYELRLRSPAGIARRFPLPSVKDGGVTVSALDEFVKPLADVRLEVRWAGARPSRLTLSQREAVVAEAVVSGTSPRTFSLKPKSADGVLIATVWGEDGAPLAERLVFRAPASPLEISIQAEPAQGNPGGHAKVKIRTTRAGKSVAATVGLVVTDDSVREMVERREQPPALPVMVLLEPEVKELADAHVYLDTKNPTAPVALDLLLGTQGWRRFALVSPEDFVNQHGDKGKRVLAWTPSQLLTISSVGGFGGAQEGAAVGFGLHGPPPTPAVPQAPAAQVIDDIGKDQPKKGAKLAPLNRLHEGAVRANVDGDDRVRAPIQNEKSAAVVVDRKRPVAQAKEMAAPVVAGKIVAKEKAQLFAADREERRLARQMHNPVAYARVYAHSVRPNRQPNDRVDFAETLYWAAGLQTDAKTGEATAEFDFSDAVTTFRVSAGGFTRDGSLGEASVAVQSVQPFYVEMKMPLEITEGDEVLMPLTLVNTTSTHLSGVLPQVQAPRGIVVSGLKAIDVAAGARVRLLAKVKANNSPEPREMTLTAMGGNVVDSVTRSLRVTANGFPGHVDFGGTISGTRRATHTVGVPASAVPGSVVATIQVFPNPAATLTQAMERLIQEPYGCFEQTSSTSYPLTMAQQYFLSHTGVDPALVAKAKDTLERGYRRLISFETPEKGYEWFAENPGHEALTAFGLMHFADMAKVREVDAAMVQRTREWLLKQRDGKGGFERRRRALHTWVEDKDASDSYITWALLASGESAEKMRQEVANVRKLSAAARNTYVTALGANVLLQAGDKSGAAQLMAKLAAAQDNSGAVKGATQSIVGSGGEALDIETTSLAVLAWLKEPKFATQVEKGMRFLTASCEGGRYGSTQSTVLALRAIVAYDAAHATPKAAGKLRVRVDGKEVGAAVAFGREAQSTILLPDISSALTPGTHAVDVAMEGGSEMSYAISVQWSALTPETSEATTVSLDTRLAQPKVLEGETTEIVATIRNKSENLIPTSVAIVGFPGGLEPRHDQLKELKKKGTIDAFEVIGRNVVLYWKGMRPKQEIAVPLSAVAAIPGTYTGAASRAYLYYTDEHKHWAEGLRVTIAPRQ